jgi:hypothetical protein
LPRDSILRKAQAEANREDDRLTEIALARIVESTFQ